MEFLKKLFESGSITYEQFVEGCNKEGFKVADLATGNYVAKKKYEDEISAKETVISDLQGQITTRDTDLANLKADLEKATTSGSDNQTTIETLRTQLSTLQSDYDTAKSDYEKRLSGQQYEFAVTEFANGLQFTSEAAKKQFKNEMISASLKMKDKSIIGATDFLNSYKETNADSFKVEQDPEPTPEPEKKPSFGQPTPPQPAPDDNAFISAFSFNGVRPHNQ